MRYTRKRRLQHMSQVTPCTRAASYAPLYAAPNGAATAVAAVGQRNVSSMCKTAPRRRRVWSARATKRPRDGTRRRLRPAAAAARRRRAARSRSCAARLGVPPAAHAARARLRLFATRRRLRCAALVLPHLRLPGHPLRHRRRHRQPNGTPASPSPASRPSPPRADPPPPLPSPVRPRSAGSPPRSS